MAAKKEKKGFDWTAGSRLSPDMYDPLGNVREEGFKKVADGIYADPMLRKEARKKKLLKSKKLKTEGAVWEESNSGLREDFTPSEASRLIHKDTHEFRGIRRFKKDNAGNKKEE